MERNERWYEIVQIILTDIARRWRSIIMCTLVFAVAADMVISLTHHPLYRSEATFALKTGNQYMTSDQIDEIADIASAFGYIISSNVFKQDVMEDMGVDTLDGYFETSSLSGTNIISIAAVSSSPRTSYRMMISMLDRYKELSQLVLGNVDIELMQNISIPQDPYNQISHRRNLIQFGMIGLVFSVAVIALFSFLSDSVKTKEDMEAVSIPYAASIPRERKWFWSHGMNRKKTILLSQLSTSFRFIEDVKKLRVEVERRCEKHGWKTILITSSLENEGKSSVLSNLGLALAENHKKVLLIDGDLRKPALHKIFEKESNDGLRKVLEGKADLQDVIIRDEQSSLDLLLGHSSFTDAGDQLDGERMRDILKEARERYDYVLVDSVPSALFTDAVTLARLCDTCLLVVRQNFISVKVVAETLEKLKLARVPIFGYVLNQKLPIWWKKVTSDRYDYRYGHYGYGYGRRRREADGEHK